MRQHSELASTIDRAEVVKDESLALSISPPRTRQIQRKYNILPTVKLQLWPELGGQNYSSSKSKREVVSLSAAFELSLPKEAVHVADCHVARAIPSFNILLTPSFA